jgi:hypothetical protein
MAPEGQDFWEQYEEDGLVFIKVATEGASGTPSAGEQQQWVNDLGLTHPLLIDPGQTQIPYVVTGYPTFVVIDRGMVIQNPDLWPWDPGYVTSFL